MNRAHWLATVAASCAIALGATACNGNDDSASSGTSPSKERTAGDVAGGVVAPAATTAGTTAAAAPNGAPSATAAPAGTAATAETSPLDPGQIDLPAVPPQNKFLAIDVSYGLEVENMSKAINDVVALSDRNGGQIYERSINITDDRSSTASFVIKLPPDKVETAIAELDAIGIRRTASQGTEDVTGQAIDIDARLLTAQASLDRVRKLLETATDLGQILSLESQLTERETLVEQYVAMRRAINDRVSLATLRLQLSLSPEPATTTTTTTTIPDTDKTETKPEIGKAFKTGWKGFVTALAAALIFFGYTAPFLAIVLVGAAVLIPITRRSRRRAALRSRSVVPPHPPAPDEDPRTSVPDSAGAARTP